VDGWTVVDTNPVKVVSVNVLAANEGNALAGVNVLALHQGSILRVLPTVAGQSYTLSFVNHGRPVANNPAGWWKGDNNALDSSVNGNNGNLNNAAGYTNGEVAQAFSFNGIDQYLDVADNTNLNPTQAMTAEAWINPAVSPELFIAPIIKKDGTATTANGGYALEYDYFSTPSSSAVKFWVYTAGSGWIGSPDTPVTPANTWTHLAGVYDGTNVTVYMNGVSAGSNAAPGPLLSSPLDLQLAHDPAPIDGPPNPDRYFEGAIDEATVYGSALSQLQVQDIYAAGSAGKLPVALSNAMVAANVIIGGVTNVFTGVDQWTTNIITFTAPSNGTVLEIQPIGTNNDGMLVDSFQLVGNPSPNPGNYYLPEESLDTLEGEVAQGNWQLEVLDNRLGATNPAPTLVSWQLSLNLERVNPSTIPLSEGVTNTNTVPPGFISYYVVVVPPWAQFATNILNVTSGGPVSLLFNQNALPGLTNGDVTLINNTTTGGTVTLSAGSTPPLVPGTQYYLAVTNSGTTPATFTLNVNFDITTLTNLVPVTSVMPAITTQPRYFQFNVPAVPTVPAVSFLLYNLSGNVDLVASKGFPLPTTSSFNYASANPGTNDDIITISSNSSPVALSPGWWYLGVYNHDVNPVNYTIEAAELTPTIILLTNDVPYTMTNESPLAAQETFFEFDITTAPAGALFELYGMSGNVDLDLDLDTLPFSPPYSMYGTPNPSANPGTNGEQIVLRTSSGPANLNGIWYLGTPNQTSGNVTYTIHAVVTDTNGLLVSGVPINPVVTLPVAGSGTGPTLTWPAVNGECYEVDFTPDVTTPWSPLPIFPNPVTASGTTVSVIDPMPITGNPSRYYRIVQVVCP